ncbi:MAG: KpsF/GutQ family sugar-phosphate isomerase, partial [Alistipes sp.]|nr:KpsF/GutQ family sugar-phosphate isomerase [Alistipes sp.]
MAVNKDMVLEVARKAIHTEALALKHLEASLGEAFVRAVEIILASEGKVIVTGMGKSGHVGCK